MGCAARRAQPELARSGSAMPAMPTATADVNGKLRLFRGIVYGPFLVSRSKPVRTARGLAVKFPAITPRSARDAIENASPWQLMHTERAILSTGRRLAFCL